MNRPLPEGALEEMRTLKSVIASIDHVYGFVTRALAQKR